jgi:receptor expression-enhancing protein 5/6
VPSSSPHPPPTSTSPTPRNHHQAIEKKGSTDVKDWAEYWVVLAVFYVSQWLIDFVLCWLPFYYLAKLGFLLALWHPSTRLAQSIYQKVRACC